MSFIPADKNASQQHKQNIERQSTESSSNNESFRSTPKGTPDLSIFTPKNNPDGIKIKSFVAASESDDYLSYSDDSENNLQKRVKVSTPLQIMKKTQQEFPEKRHKHHHHHQSNEKSKNDAKLSQPTKNIQSRDIHLNQNNNFDEDENPFDGYGDQSPKMLSSSSVQTGEKNSGSKNFNEEHEVLMKPRNLGKRKPKLVNIATQVKYHVVNTNKPPELKVENVQTRDVDQFEIDFDDEENEEKNKNSKNNNRNNIEVNDTIKSPKSPHEKDNIQCDQSPRHNQIDKEYDNRKSPKHRGKYEKEENDRRKSPRHHHEDDREYGKRKSPRHHLDDDEKYERRSPKQRPNYDDREHNRRKSPRHRDEYGSDDYAQKKSPRHHRDDDREYERRSPKHHDYDDREYNNRKSPRHRDDDNREYNRSKSPRHHNDYDDREYNRSKSPRHHNDYDDREYERKSPRHHDDDREYNRRKSPRHHHDDEKEYGNRRSPRYHDEYGSEDYGRRKSPRHHRDDDRDYKKRRSPRNRNEYETDEHDRHRSPRKHYDDRMKSPKNHNKDRLDNEPQSDKQILERQDFSSSNSIDRLADSIQPNTLTRGAVPLPEQIPPESPTKATQTTENDIFERDFNLPENDDDEAGEGLRVLSSIFNDISSDSFAATNQNQQRVNRSIEKAKMLKEIAFPKTPKLADISIQIDMSEDEKQEGLLSSSFDRRFQEIDLQNESDLIKERDVDLRFIQQGQELSEGSDVDNNRNNTDSFNFILSENDDDNKMTKPAQKVPSKVRLLADSTDLAKLSSKASFRSKSGDVTIAPNFTEDSISSIEQPPDSEKKENLIPLSEELQAIEPSMDQTKTKETLSAALSSIDLYTDNEEEEEAKNKTENGKNFSFGDRVRERGFGQVNLNSHSDASNDRSNRSNKQEEILSSSKSQNSQQLAATQKIMSNENSLSDIPKSPRTHESMLSNEKLLSQPSNTDESEHSTKSNQSKKSYQSNKSDQSHQSYQSTRSNQSDQSNHSQSAKSNQSQKSNYSNKKDNSKKPQTVADQPKSAFSLIYSEQETDEMNKSTNKTSPFTKRNRPFSSSERIDPTSATLSHSSAKPKTKQIPSSPKSTNSNNSGIINRSGLSSQSFSHSPPINDDVFEEEEEFESSNLSSEKSSNIFIKNKDVQLTPSEESSLIRDFPGDSTSKKQKEKANKDFPIKNSPSTSKIKQEKENSQLSQEMKQNSLQNIESSSHSNIEFVKNRNIGMRQSEESSLINDFPGDSYNSERTKKQQKEKSKNDQLDFPRVLSNSSGLKEKSSASASKPKSSSTKTETSKQNSPKVSAKTESPKASAKPTSPKLSEKSNSPKLSTKAVSPKSSAKPTSPKSSTKTESPKSKQNENSIKSEIIQLQASDYSENSRPVFNFEGDNSENISKRLRSLKMQNSSSLSSSLNRNAKRQQNSNERKDKSQDSQSQSYESNSINNKNKNKIFKPITLDQLSSESDSFNKLQKKNDNKALHADDLDDNSSISDNFSNSKGKTTNNKVNNINNYNNRQNQMKNYLNDNDEKASSSNEEND